MITTHSPAAILAQYLIQQSFAVAMPGTTADWPVTFSRIADVARDKVIGIKDTNGIKDGRLMTSGEVIDKPGIQVLTRALDYHDARQKLVDIIRDLDALKWFPIVYDSTPYRIDALSRTSNLIYVGREEGRQRELFSVNYLITINGV